ncbi:unnamed protein product [Lactuca saligna]|uniref:Transmembrane 9 superfamily member n=1 Tax=Lactuca saligna TaxID=75948 RepID=A0AA35Z807_LACSI|nr:unnamed protein product [Lactuca saligna]
MWPAVRSPPSSYLAAALFISSFFLISSPVFASEYDHKYQPDEAITLWVNKVGPYNNPQETYNYYSLPFCRRHGNPGHKWGGLGEVLGGNELIDSQFEIKFQKNVEKTTICALKLDEANVKHFKEAIDNNYWFEFFMDDLPLWGFVGELHSDRNSDNKHMIFTHKNITLQYNKDQIIHVNLTQENPKPLEVGKTLDMTYSVKWTETNITFARRFDVYLDYHFFEHQIHWFSIFNSFMMVIFLTGLVSMILMRTLRNDYAKYAREDDDLESLERDVSEESGWKLVHGDVFRPPRNLVLLSAVVGTGAQLALLILLVILFAIVATLYIGRGAIVTTFIVCYALTSFVSGYVSGGMYSRHGGKNWIKSMILTASLFPLLCFGIGFVLNTIAIFYGSLAAIPFGTMVVVFVIWAFISFPLALLGTVVGRNWSGAPNNPCRVKTIPRPIPDKKWYLTPSVVSIMGGLLPFGSIFIEMYFVFTSFWNYKVYYVYGFMLLVFIILVIVTVCVTIVGTYFLLNAENYHWQWTSFFSAASTAIYVYLYSIYYYSVKTKMSGFFQTSFYFGYTAMFCLGLGILCGAVGYLGSNLFVLPGLGVIHEWSPKWWNVRRVDVIYSDIVLLPPDVVVPLPFLPLCLETQGADDLLDDGVDMRQWCKDTLSKTMVRRQGWFSGARVSGEEVVTMAYRDDDWNSHLREWPSEGVVVGDGLRMVVLGFLEEVRDERKRNIDRGDDEVGGKVGQGPFFLF